MKKFLIITIFILGSITLLFECARADVYFSAGRRHRHYEGHPRYYYSGRIYYPFSVYQYTVYPETYYGSHQVKPGFLPVTEIANMASAGVPDGVIISEIDRTRSSYILNSEIITYLKQNRVSDRVIDYMLQTRKIY